MAELEWEINGTHGRILTIGGEAVISVEDFKQRDVTREDPLDMYAPPPNVITISDD